MDLVSGAQNTAENVSSHQTSWHPIQTTLLIYTAVTISTPNLNTGCTSYSSIRTTYSIITFLIFNIRTNHENKTVIL